MEKLILIQKEDLEKLIEKLVQKIEKKEVPKNSDSLEKVWLTNKEVCKYLSVTPRTMQNYRDKGIIPFSQVGSKIYYKQSDLDAHLESHFHVAYNKGRRLS